MNPDRAADGRFPNAVLIHSAPSALFSAHSAVKSQAAASSRCKPERAILRERRSHFKLKNHPAIDPLDIKRALDQPARKMRQQDGRVRYWVWATNRQRWLRVVTEPDGETVHNAFWDRNYEP